MSKAFDYGTACVSEQALIVDRSVARELRHEMTLRGAHFYTEAESARLASAIFDAGGNMRPDRVAQLPQRLAELADIELPSRVRVLVSEQNQVGRRAPLSAEKLNPVLAWYESRDADEGIVLAQQVVGFGGQGHTAVLHAEDVCGERDGDRP